MAIKKQSAILIRRGLNLPLAGLPDQVITAGAATHSVALQGADYLGLKPRMRVEPGQHVAAGQPLFVDKRDPDVCFTAPVSGTVTMINRGARRSLQSVVIEIDDAQPPCDEYRELAGQDLGSLTAAEITAPLYKSGLWTAFRTRPYSKVPLSGSRPAAIFVTAIDTQPLAADPAVIIDEHVDAFKQGLRVVARLTDGAIFLCTAPDWQGPQVEGVTQAVFAGPHPAGLPGTHIHHLNPASADNTVWHIGYQDVIAIGMLFAEGRLWTERVIALGGQNFKQPRLVTTRLGASIEELVAGELQSDIPARIVSGSVLNGRVAEGADAYLGRYHLQVTTVPKLHRRRLLGWLRSGAYSYAGLLSARNPRPAGQLLTTAQCGRPTAMLPIDAFDKVMPLDLLPVPLLKALLIKDTDQAQLLGCLELDPEDLALCSFICPGKNDYGAVLLENLKQIERDG